MRPELEIRHLERMSQTRFDLSQTDCSCTDLQYELWTFLWICKIQTQTFALQEINNQMQMSYSISNISPCMCDINLIACVSTLVMQQRMWLKFEIATRGNRQRPWTTHIAYTAMRDCQPNVRSSEDVMTIDKWHQKRKSLMTSDHWLHILHTATRIREPKVRSEDNALVVDRWLRAPVPTTVETM